MELCQEMERHSCHKIAAHYEHITVLRLKETDQLKRVHSVTLTYFKLSSQVA